MMLAAHNSTQRAFTRIDLLVVVFGVIALGFIGTFFVLPLLARAKQGSHLSCANYLKQIGTAYQIWANDHMNQLPSQASEAAGGWRERLSESDPGRFCFTNYVIMANELGESSRVLICPKDERIYQPGKEVSQISNNFAISYFVGVNASASDPNSILAGDRNLSSGAVLQNDYGYSPENGLGNDVTLREPVCWSQKMHSASNRIGAGNILLRDCSVQPVTSLKLRDRYLSLALTNHIPIRFIFP